MYKSLPIFLSNIEHISLSLVGILPALFFSYSAGVWEIPDPFPSIFYYVLKRYFSILLHHLIWLNIQLFEYLVIIFHDSFSFPDFFFLSTILFKLVNYYLFLSKIMNSRTHWLILLTYIFFCIVYFVNCLCFFTPSFYFCNCCLNN